MVPEKPSRAFIGISELNFHGENFEPAYVRHVRFGSKADICGATSHVRFTPNCDRKSGYLRFVMSALPPKADICSALAHVRYGPNPEVGTTRLPGSNWS